MSFRPLSALLLAAALAGCAGGTSTPTESELPGTIGAPVTTPAPHPGQAAPAPDSVWDVAARDGGFRLNVEHFPWSSAYYQKHGQYIPEGGLEKLREFDAIFLIRFVRKIKVH